MTPTETVNLSQIAELLAANGYDVTGADSGVLRARELQSGIGFQAALEGNVLYMSVHLETCPESKISPQMLRKMLDGENGISTSSFRLYTTEKGKVSVTLNNFCKLQDMGAEDRDDVLSLAGYLLADVVEARDLLEPPAAA